MAKFELCIYNENDEIAKMFATDHVRYGVLEDALAMTDDAEGQKKGVKAQFQEVKKIVKRIFPGCTDEDLNNADTQHVFSTFRQLVKYANVLDGDGEEKNG